ncbi:MAG: ABC transporter ATP-binding protein [Nitrospira sp.]|nr:ABC transporter ATP-binding protein [Candidatus Manganitrophaceae bacterium]HIL34137.1 ABC transporter ATP-binding protein [Candidatus Manganitrophaceae bacterium]
MNDPTEALLQVQDLRTWFYTEEGVVRAIDGVSFEVHRGETFALVGESGSGKSMTALSIMKLVPEPAGRIISGKILLEGEDLCQFPEMGMRRLRGRRISMIFQEPMTSLNPVMTVGAQITETLQHHFSMKSTEARRRACELLDLVGIPDPIARYSEYPHQMSGGMKQRIMIAMALSGEPDLLIADEPTTALDVTIQAQILELLKKLQKERGMALLLITHDLAVVSEIAEKVAVMYAGQIVEMSDRDPFFDHPQHPYSQKLFNALPLKKKRGERLEIIRGNVPALNKPFSGCRFANRCDAAWDHCEQVVPQWISLETGGVRCHLASPRDAATRPIASKVVRESEAIETQVSIKNETLLNISDLKVHFPIQKGLFKKTVGYVKAVDGVSLAIDAGKTLALVGESGCGKTTTGKAILQLIQPSAGSIFFDDVDLTQLTGEDLRKKRKDFQIIFQDPYSSLNPRMMVRDIIKEGMDAQKINREHAGPPMSRDEEETTIDRLLDAVGLPSEVKNRYPHEFSGGQRQRICIARVLAVNPKLIVCDEPTSALDVSVQAQILNLLKSLQEKLGLAYLFITHNISVVEYFAHEIAVMYLGRIVEYGLVEEVLENPKHPYTRALLSAVPQVDLEQKRSIIRLEGDLPSPISPPQGCHFHPRCPEALPICRENYPSQSSFSASHNTCCHLYETPPSSRLDISLYPYLYHN